MRAKPGPQEASPGMVVMVAVRKDRTFNVVAWRGRDEGLGATDWERAGQLPLRPGPNPIVYIQAAQIISLDELERLEGVGVVMDRFERRPLRPDPALWKKPPAKKARRR